MTADPFQNFRLVKRLNDTYRHQLAGHPARFRASLGSISFVSHHPHTSQLGFKCRYNELLQDPVDMEAYLNRLCNMKPPGRPTPEKDLQSWILQYALRQGGLPFDPDIMLFTDEFAREDATGKLVADILGFNSRTGTLVVIELKTVRALRELTRQLDGCAAWMEGDRDFYRALLLTHSFSWEAPYRIEKVAVWPSAGTSCPKRFPAGIREFCYQQHEGWFQKDRDGYVFTEVR
ncbi:hypothetical protein V9K67_21645 [Paraflavisolibacter sp. H34]|uniref:hypothetical protein n=1 Tax=Huijunlia imazamoxiresistens TaxID=3127457 RepID=UPI003018C8B8